MATIATRLLLLGAVRLFEPINAYQIRRELTSWEVDTWAHLNPGSIYSGLDTLARQGHVDRHDVQEGRRSVAVYTSTGQGRTEFQRLFREAMRTVDLTSTLAFDTALALQPLVTREEFLALLTEREAVLAQASGSKRVAIAQATSSPPHLSVMTELWEERVVVERDWLRRTVAAVESGALEFAGEPSRWTPPPDDPGWSIEEDRRRYRRLLNLDG